MEAAVKEAKGWKPIPVPLKILSVVFVLWTVGAVMNMPNLMENGLPFLGVFVYGAKALIVVLILDVVGPMTFLFALWNKKPWATRWAYAYNGIFILNNAVAFFRFRDQLGLPQILVPTIASILFIIVIYWKRDYFVKPQ
ncbi:hypothetical protein A9Q96_07185 [Rhodobacterales bacterium 52_120_T64]|nr:hypothetical protein A9Q96_07185 [Rhodobacterales bacterium 52_120_T64]